MTSEPRTPLTLYNTLSRKKETFVPLIRDKVRMYVCGPTVYDFAHIGNARPVIVFDVLFRLLREIYGPDHVTYVRNITDVDDKIIARALEEGVDIRALTETTNQQYQDDVTALGCLPPTVQPRATEHIEAMVALIETLIERGHAYEAEGHVLFHVPSMPDYGRLSNRSVDEMQAGARVEVAPYKKDPMDFVLWKPAAEDEQGFESALGRGRPGWHIECSAMAKAHLGEEFDIHGGGIDLVFPHHENEIAQSRCAHGTAGMARYWLHNGFLQVEGEKMSKSLGNFITISDLLNSSKFGGRRWPGEVIRLCMLMTHYRKPIDWTVDQLNMAYSVLAGWKSSALSSGLSFVEENRDYYEDEAATIPTEDFLSFLKEDLNFPGAMSELNKLAKLSQHDSGLNLYANLKFVGLVTFEDMVLFQQNEQSLPASENPEIDKMILRRSQAKQDKDWAEADRIRDELLAQGIVLKDGPEGTTWDVKK